MTTFTFVTGNDNKVKELQRIVGLTSNIKIQRMDIDLPEVQGSETEIIMAKLCEAKRRLPNHNIIVEDSSLQFSALGGMPGPYIKWFLKSMELDNIVKMLDGFDDKGGIAYATFAVHLTTPDGETDYICEGKVNGTIVPPVGTNGFGWDAIFKPEGYDKTFGQMTANEKNMCSARAQALHKLVKIIN